MDLALIGAVVRVKLDSQGGGTAMLLESHKKEATVCMTQTLTGFALAISILSSKSRCSDVP
jgi:hypothetical protein